MIVGLLDIVKCLTVGILQVSPHNAKMIILSNDDNDAGYIPLNPGSIYFNLYIIC